MNPYFARNKLVYLDSQNNPHLKLKVFLSSWTMVEVLPGMEN